MTELDTIVVGAGLAGLTAARGLAAQGRRVVVLDKGRGLGGRTSRRRSDSAEFDHGAQYFTARDPLFRREVETWLMNDVATRWSPRVLQLGERKDLLTDFEWYVGAPAMNSVCRHLATGLDVRCDSKILEIRRTAQGVSVLTEQATSIGPATNIVVTAPAPQSAQLVHGVAPRLAETIRAVRMDPCWAVLLAFEQSLRIDFDVAIAGRSDAIGWIARNSSKPRRPEGEAWVLHGGSNWSSESLNADATVVIDQLTRAMAEIVQQKIDPLFSTAHLWRYARTACPIGATHLVDDEAQIFVAGDWCLGSRMESAYLSGLSVVDAILNTQESRGIPH